MKRDRSTEPAGPLRAAASHRDSTRSLVILLSRPRLQDRDSLHRAIVGSTTATAR